MRHPGLTAPPPWLDPDPPCRDADASPWRGIFIRGARLKFYCWRPSSQTNQPGAVLWTPGGRGKLPGPYENGLQARAEWTAISARPAMAAVAAYSSHCNFFFWREEPAAKKGFGLEGDMP